MKIVLFILSAIVCYLIAGGIHELGHIIMGLKEGFKFYIFVVGPFGLRRDENDKIIFYLEKDISLWGGIGGTIPVDEDDRNFKKFGRILLAGPFTSILLGVIFFSIGLSIDNSFLLLLGTMLLSMGIACLIPARNGAFYTDGGRWLRMHRNENTRVLEWAIWNVTQKAIINRNYAHTNIDDIELIKRDHDLRTQYVGHYFAYHYYKDNGEFEKAEQEKASLESLKGKVPKQMVSIYTMD